MKKQALIGLTALLLNCTPTPNYDTTPAKVQLAQCLAEKGAVMYGSEWCGWCSKQKKDFGEEAWEAFKNNYFNCEGSKDEQRLCDAKAIKSYPYWEFKDGKSRKGYQFLEDLAVISGCR